MVTQEPRPDLVIVIDDGSEDNTTNIIRDFPVFGRRIFNPRYPIRGINLCWAMNKALDILNEKLSDFSFLLKVDVDSYIPKNYFRLLKEEMEKNKRLGITSGSPHDKVVPNGRASDGAKLYRRECLNQLGVFVPVHGFDTLAILKAKYLGWEVEPSNHVKYIQLRDWDLRKISRWIEAGRAHYLFGIPLIHSFLAFPLFAQQKPYILGALSLFLSHLAHNLTGWKLRETEGYYEFTRRYFIKETFRGVNKRLAKII